MFLVVAMISPSLLPESICWVLTTGFLCLTSAGNHWLGKNNVGMTLGTWALLSASWKSISPHTPQAQEYILGIALWTGLSIQLQDLRDFDGDLAMGRKTMAIVYGDILARRIITYVLLPSAIGMLWFWNILAIAPISLTIMHIFLSYRVMHTAGGPRYDHKTFMVGHTFFERHHTDTSITDMDLCLLFCYYASCLKGSLPRMVTILVV
jgi:4-hydroxybenzoate polyprenyltransferase